MDHKDYYELTIDERIALAKKEKRKNTDDNYSIRTISRTQGIGISPDMSEAEIKNVVNSVMDFFTDKPKQGVTYTSVST